MSLVAREHATNKQRLLVTCVSALLVLSKENSRVEGGTLWHAWQRLLMSTLISTNFDPISVRGICVRAFLSTLIYEQMCRVTAIFILPGSKWVHEHVHKWAYVSVASILMRWALLTKHVCFKTIKAFITEFIDF